MFKSWEVFLLSLLFVSFTFISLASSSNEPADSQFSRKNAAPEITVVNEDRSLRVPRIAIARNLKEETSQRDGLDTAGAAESRGKFNLEDYSPVDPSPTTKASIKPGPIQHGNPLNPYIPKPPSPPPSPAPPKDAGIS